MKRLILVLLFSVAVDAEASNQDIFPWDTPQAKVAPSTMTTVGGGGETLWVVVETGDRYTLYVDSHHVGKDGNIVKLGTKYDLKTIEEVAGVPFRSVSGTAEYDCEKHLTRVINAQAYAESTVASGRQIPVNRIAEPGRWMPVVADTAQEIFWNYACAK